MCQAGWYAASRRPWQQISPGGGLRKELGVPLYHQIQHLIRHRIHTGLYPPGTQIPSEHDLCRELAVSRVTLREALRELVRENLLIKVQGKGTFVSSNPPQAARARALHRAFSRSSRNVSASSASPTSKSQQAPATPELKTTLQLSAATTELTLIKRLRHIDDEPFSYTLNYLPSEIGARIRLKDLYALPLLKILQEDLKIPIVRARETIEAAPADPDTARRLGIPVLYPVLHMTRVMYTTGDRPFELVDIYYRADKYHYSVNMVRVKRGGRWTWSTEVETSA